MESARVTAGLVLNAVLATWASNVTAGDELVVCREPISSL